MAMRYVGIYLLEAVVIQETPDTLSGGELAFGVLGLNPLRTTALFDFFSLSL